MTGADLHGMSLSELREISPGCTRVECKTLLRMVRHIESASQVSVRA